MERPDFELNARVGAAILSLYSTYVSAFLRETYTGLRSGEVLDKDFETLAGMVRSQILSRELLDVYEVKEETHNPDGCKVLRLEKVKRKSAGRSSYFPNPDWPDVAWAFPSIL